MFSLEDRVHQMVEQLGNQSSVLVNRHFTEDELINLGPSIIPIILPMLSSSNYWITSSLIEIIGRIGSIENSESIRPFLKSKDLIVLRKTAYALARLGDPDAIDDLLAILQHPSWHVKYACADALSLYFNHPELHETLLLRFLTAFFQKNNQEDIVIAKFSENGWDKEILVQNPAKYLKCIIQKSLNLPLSPGDWALLKYFSSLTFNLIEESLLIYNTFQEKTSLIYLNSKINEYCSLCLQNEYRIFL